MSNYTISLSSAYVDRYNPVQATGPKGQFNDAAPRYLSGALTDRQGRINDSGIRYLMDLQEKAKGLADRLNDPTNSAAMQTMVAAMPQPQDETAASAPEPAEIPEQPLTAADVREPDPKADASDWIAPYRESLASYATGTKETADSPLQSQAASTVSSSEPPSAQQIEKLTDGFNTLLDVARQGEEFGNNRLRMAMESAMEAYYPQLSRIGVSVGEDGALSLDRTRMDASVESGALQQDAALYQSAYQGLRERLNSVAQDVVANPAYYVGPNSADDVSPGNHWEDDASVSSQPYLQSRNQQWYQLGFLIDLFV